MAVTGFQGRLEFDTDKPDGPPRKLLDTSRHPSLGWKPKITLRAGIAETYAWFKDHVADARLVGRRPRWGAQGSRLRRRAGRPNI